jgi:hypothetical protein
VKPVICKKRRATCKLQLATCPKQILTRKIFNETVQDCSNAALAQAPKLIFHLYLFFYPFFSHTAEKKARKKQDGQKFVAS